MGVYSVIKSNLCELYSKISPDNFDEWYDDVRGIVSLFTDLSYLEYYLKILDSIKESYEVTLRKAEKEEKEKIQSKIGRISFILNLLEQKRPDIIIERLRREGEKLAREENIREAFSNQIYRILEQTRLGKRDIVLYMIVRILSAFSREVPKELVEVIKPQYDIQLFRSFIYSFLSAFPKEKKESTEEEKNG